MKIILHGRDPVHQRLSSFYSELPIRETDSQYPHSLILHFFASRPKAVFGMIRMCLAVPMLFHRSLRASVTMAPQSRSAARAAAALRRGATWCSRNFLERCFGLWVVGRLMGWRSQSNALYSQYRRVIRPSRYPRSSQ